MNKKLIYIVAVLLIGLISIMAYSAFNYTGTKKSSSEVVKYDYETNRNINNTFVSTDKSGNRVNKSYKIKEGHNYKNLAINNLSITSNKNNLDEATISFKVLNNNSYKITDYDLLIEFYDREGDTKASIVFHIDSLESGSEKEFKEKTTYRVLDSYDYKASEAIIRGA